MNYFLFFLLSAFWGGSFVAIKIAVNSFPPFFDALLRVGVSLIILGLLFSIMKKNLKAPFEIQKKMWLVGLFSQGVPFAFLFWGERFIAPGLAGILNGTVPILTFVLSPLFVANTDFSANKILGLILGILGVIIIFSPMLTFSGYPLELIGSLSLLAMSLSYALGGLLNQKLLAHHREWLHANVFNQHCVSVIFLLVLSLSFEKWPTWQAFQATPSVWIAIGYLALFSTALAWLMYFWLLQEWGPVRASTVTYVAPIMAIFWDYIFFHNTPHFNEIIGIIIILTGVIFIQVPKDQLRKVLRFG